ncbi:LptF/LptG family permease [Aquimarina sp. I32.4]|uniref:LptF/LptG family permease n=1 Tax=Aquimarina sp. I32.4 TaxID=2053903 RepID=UPI000CDF14DA|nr:LptF/LptG family permease [Aquimarina sp. I32.4]
MKILDRYILTTFVKTFFPLFIIIMFILLLQTIWLFISELAGKDLDFSVILKFLTFATPRLIPMVLPLTILLTSIMIFGNFAENYEFAAMKSSGISLPRAMRTLAVFIFFVGIGAFIFSNTVIPSSEKRFINLRKNIVKVKPAMVITPNQFNDLGNINIKVAEKYGDNDELLRDVIIHKKAARPGNFTVIKAVGGELKGSVNSDLITLILNDGNYYDEIHQKSSHKKNKLPFAKTHFKQYVLNIDLSSLGNVDMDAQQYSKGFNMLNVSELKNEIDSISGKVNRDVKNINAEIDRRIGHDGLNKNIKIDTLQTANIDTLDVRDYFETQDKIRIYQIASSNVDAVLRKIETAQKNVTFRQRALNKYEMSLHNKYALGISCILLFFVGAPLGAIIRKGGLGLPMVIGVVLFLTYHFIGIFAKNGAEEGGVPPFVGSWLSTWIIFPLSIFLTYRAATDQGIFNMDIIIQPIRDFFTKKKEQKEQKEFQRMIESISRVKSTSATYQLMADYEYEKLKDVVMNYKLEGYDEDYRITALKILEEKGITIEELKKKGHFQNEDFDRVTSYYKMFNGFSIASFLFSIINTVIVSSNVVAGLICIVLSFVMLYVAMSYHGHFYRVLKNRAKPTNVILVVIGVLFYVIGYFYFKGTMKQDIKATR